MADEKRPDEAERVVRREDADDVEGHKVTKVGLDEDDVAGHKVTKQGMDDDDVEGHKVTK